jgi:hypothetical protein
MPQLLETTLLDGKVENCTRDAKMILPLENSSPCWSQPYQVEMGHMPPPHLVAFFRKMKQYMKLSNKHNNCTRIGPYNLISVIWIFFTIRSLSKISYFVSFYSSRRLLKVTTSK